MAEERTELFGFSEVSLNAARPVLGFYQKHGYTAGPWFDVNPEREDSVRLGKRLARLASRRSLMLTPPSLDGIAGYVVALEAGWSPDTTHDVSGEQLAIYRRDPAALIDELTRSGGTIKTASGETVPKLPNRVFWLNDGEFCGLINLRFRPGTDALPPHVNSHVG
jgi:hypothetical protein